MIPSMSRQGSRRLRLMTVLPALAIFFAGTHLCVLSALTGQVMACSGVPVSRVIRKSCPNCTHHDAGKRPVQSAATLSPCCVTLAPSTTIQVERPDVAATPLSLAGVQVEPVFSRALSARLATDERPPTRPLPLDPFGGRAPPLF